MDSVKAAEQITENVSLPTLEENADTEQIDQGVQATEQSILVNVARASLEDNMTTENMGRPQRVRKQTEKMHEYQMEEVQKKEKRLLSLYNKWKVEARGTRNKLKSYIPEDNILQLIDVLKASSKDVIRLFDEIRQITTPSVDVRRRVDTCEAVTKELLAIAYERAVDDEDDFDAEKEQNRMHELLCHEHARSVYGSEASISSHNSSSRASKTSLAVKRAEAAADLAAKKANYELRLEEERRRAVIVQLEENQKRELESQKIALERLQAAREVSVAEVKLKFLNKEMNGDHNEFSERAGPSTDPSIVAHALVPDSTTSNAPPAGQVTALTVNQPKFITVKAPVHTPACDYSSHTNSSVRHLVRDSATSASSVVGPPVTSDFSSFAQMLQDNLVINRLPAPEPFVFTGDPIQFIEWKAAFVTLIGRRTADPAEKLYYLKQYVGGPAKQVLDGTFFRSDGEAFLDAWNRLERRFGHPFTVQRAFREKLNNWPKIHGKDAEGLRHFADFLNTCLEAIPHVKGLDVLNDCEENQKLIAKLPDWATASWNRQVTSSLMDKNTFPSFKEFVSFVTFEADIACNPITSLHALHSGDSRFDKRYLSDIKRPRASILTTQTSTSRFQKNCSLCNEEYHRLHMCTRFKEFSVIERRAYIKDNLLCYGCLGRGHRVKDCRQRHVCEDCGGRHPTLLHDENFGKEVPVVTVQEDNSATSLRVAANTNLLTSMILPVWVSSKKKPSEEVLVYALLDSQSDTTFIDQNICDMLDTDKCSVKLKLTTMSATGMVIQSERISGLSVRGFNSDIRVDLPVTYSKDCIPLDIAHIPTRETAIGWSHLSCIIEEMQPLKNCEVGLLIGYNCSRAMTPRQVITGGNEEPYAIRTDLGWSIVGGAPQQRDVFKDHICYRTTVKEQPPLTPSDAVRILESDFRDFDNDEVTLSQDDVAFLNKVGDGIKRNEQGHYEMPLPFKIRPILPNNKEMAMSRLNQLKRKLQRNPNYRDQYVQYMEEVINSGDAEQVENEGCEGEKWYIPHHGVRHSKKPERLRVVFDGSAKFKGTCLNDHLLSGPDLLNSLLGILIRFRQHPVALICDIEKMFHQFHVVKEDRDFLRFFWWKGGDLNSSPAEFRMKVHLFGAVSSPGCANFGLKHLAKKNSGTFPQASQFLLRDFYVDDGLTSVPSSEEALKLALEAMDLCATGGLRLHKFLSNDRTVVSGIPESERANNIKNLDLRFESLPLERALGVQWNVEADNFTFKINVQEQPATRRGILSTVASLYDPLGFVAPVLLKAKTILQEMCRRGVTWDEQISEELLPHWLKWKIELRNLTNVSIQRTYVPVEFGPIFKVELHHFSDASTKGYGQCSYLRFQNESGMTHCALILGKSRVSPIKVTTIPRLELTAAVVSVQASRLLKQELQFPDMAEYFWTDSRVVLGYIKNEARRFHTFVANRIQKIHLGSSPVQWRYISSEENPADHASRGLTPNELLSSNWLIGLQFLWEKELVLPQDDTSEVFDGDPEVRNATVLDTKSLVFMSLVDRLNKFSSWTSVVRAVARLLRWVKGNKENQPSTVMEKEQAKHCIIKDLQGTVFKDELKLMKDKDSLPSRSPLCALDPILDQEGILRLGGRLKNSSLDSSVKHPIIIPRDHHLTTLLISHCHETVKHQGKGMTINCVRSSGFWIPGIGHAVASCIYKCVKCRRQRRPTENQKMADLPQERVEPSPPFTFSGMDCFGPFITKQGRKEHKRYGLLFTCLSSRAIHIEMLEDLSTDSFINGLRCFIAIRGSIRLIRCDQGTNFVGAKNEFAHALQELNKDKLSAYLANQQCDFVMNAPYASHAGGVWERQIRTVRNILRMTIDLSNSLKDASLRTFFYEAMAIVNSRPLTVNTLCHPHGPQPLTPNHLLTMKTSQAVPPPGYFAPEDVYSKKQWRQVQYLAEQFWSRWRKEYLANITIRQRWHKPKRNLQIGDIVILKDDEAVRNEWRLGKVIETLPSKDGLVRKVRLKLGDRRSTDHSTRTSVVERPIQKLVVLVEAAAKYPPPP